MRKLVFQLIFFLAPLLTIGQNTLDFRQFYFNPFLFNPAYGGINGFTEFSLAHRQQWMDFEDSPVASGFSVQHPLKNRSALGFNFYTKKAVALRTSSAQFAFAYAIPLAPNQSFRFALLGGMGINDLDLEGRDYSNDPLILRAAQNRVFAQGSFGFLYHYEELIFGFALPTLFNQQETGAGVLKTHPLEQLVNQLYTVRYKVELNDKGFSVEPYFLYRINRDLQNYWEVATIVHFKDRLHTGLSFQQHSGLAFFIGLTFRDHYRMGYSYEVPRKKSTGSGSHEFQLNIGLSKKSSSESEVGR
jgi:type IX secretion system PorP/SprF family membrane protein